MKQLTAYPHINALLDNILSRMQPILGTKLVGLYLYGSLVTGDFDRDISDVDLLAATYRSSGMRCCGVRMRGMKTWITMRRWQKHGNSWTIFAI